MRPQRSANSTRQSKITEYIRRKRERPEPEEPEELPEDVMEEMLDKEEEEESESESEEIRKKNKSDENLVYKAFKEKSIQLMDKKEEVSILEEELEF